MKPLRCLTVFLLLAMVSCGCVQHRTPVVPPVGLIFTKYRAPLTTDYARTPVCEKSGKASTYYLLIPLFPFPGFAWDDASVEKAAKNGRLDTVEYADYEIVTVLGIFGQYTTIAYGS